MRPIMPGRQIKAIGRYPSEKCGCSYQYESSHELHGFWHAEVDTAVQHYRAQPHTLRIEAERDPVSYTPDREDVLACGTIRIIEIKGKFEPKRDPLYTQKLEWARAIYNSMGWRFDIVERAELEAQPKFKFVEAIQAYRRTSVTLSDIDLIRNLFEQQATLPFEKVQAVFASKPVGFAKVSAMIVRRLLSIDLAGGIIGQSPLALGRL